MKYSILLLGFAAISAVQALSECVLTCQASAGQSECNTGNYNQTSCYCNNGDFVDSVSSCIRNACSDDLGNWYSYRGSTCDGSSSTAVTATATTSGTQTRSPAATATISLTSCILSCQASAADSVGGVCSETNYNETECYCNTPTFATEAQDCVFDDCAGDAGILHQWRGAVCLSSGGDTGNAETEVSSIKTATATSAAATAATTTTGSVSSATSSTTSGQSSGSGGSGLSGGAIAGICVGTIVGGLAIIGLVALTIIRRRRRYPFHGRRTNGSDAYALHKLQSDQAQQEM